MRRGYLKYPRNKPMALQSHVFLEGKQTMNFATRALPMLAAAAALCLSSGVYAQEPAAPPAPGAEPHHHGADHAEWRKAHEEHRARFLHDILNLRPDQETAFQTFQADMKPQPREHKDWAEHKAGEHGAGEQQALTTPERLDRMAAFMTKRTAEHQAAFQHRADAIKRFYAVLSPEQKRAFDALHAMRGDQGGRHGEDRGGERHQRGPGEHEPGEAGAGE